MKEFKICGMDSNEVSCSSLAVLKVTFKNDDFKAWNFICRNCGDEQKAMIETREELPRRRVAKERLAREFTRILRKWLTPDQMKQVIARNKAETDSSVCHSHDFCDANEAMAMAFERLGLETPNDGSGEYSFRQWNQAWDLAKKSNFRRTL